MVILKSQPGQRRGLMDRFMSRLQTIWAAIFGPSLEEMMDQASRIQIPEDISNLYILRVDFAVSMEKREVIANVLAPIREKYGIDFLIAEPGMKFEPFLPASIPLREIK